MAFVGGICPFKIRLRLVRSTPVFFDQATWPPALSTSSRNKATTSPCSRKSATHSPYLTLSIVHQPEPKDLPYKYQPITIQPAILSNQAVSRRFIDAVGHRLGLACSPRRPKVKNRAPVTSHRADKGSVWLRVSPDVEGAMSTRNDVVTDGLKEHWAQWGGRAVSCDELTTLDDHELQDIGLWKWCSKRPPFVIALLLFLPCNGALGIPIFSMMKLLGEIRHAGICGGERLAYPRRARAQSAVARELDHPSR